MTSRIAAALAGLGLAFCVAGSAEAQIIMPGNNPRPAQPQQPQQPAGLISAVTQQQLAQLLQPAGLQKVELVTGQGGQKGIKGELNGTPVIVALSACQADACAMVSYLVLFGQQQVDLNFINSFNRDRGFARLVQTKDNSLILAMDTHLIGGVSPANISAQAAVFASAIKNLLEYRPE